MISIHKQLYPSLLLSLFLGLQLWSTAHAEPVTLNLKNADIRSVISTVSEITGKNFIVDPRVKGKVTIISSKPMDDKVVYQVFLSLLQVHGFTAVPSKNAIKILPDATAKQNSLPTAADHIPGKGAEMVTRILEIKNVSAAQLVPILRPLVPQQGHLAAYAPSNILIISDRADNIRRLQTIIASIDHPEGSELEIVTLKNASAIEVVKVLNSLSQSNNQTRNQAASGSRPILVADERTNSIIIGGNKSSRLHIRSVIAHLDAPLKSEGNIHVVYLHYADAKDLAGVLTGIKENLVKEVQSVKGAKAQANRASNTYIQADENTNSLVISAPPELYKSLMSVIRQLDIRRAQVMVEAIIAEISTNKSAELGIQWAVGSNPAKNSPVGITNFGDPSLGGILSSVASGVPPTSAPNGLTLGLGSFGSNKMNFAVLLNALNGDGSTNVLSTPTLMTLDNNEAQIVVGKNVPFLTGSFSSTGGGSNPTNPFTTINREDVGLTLKVKPQINEGSTIKLEIEQEVSNVDFSADSTAGFITNKRSISTTVMVEDNSIIVLGGLIQDDVKESEQKVPLLGDIPFIGALFRHKKTIKSKTNLMVFIHPRIIREASTGTSLSADRYNAIRASQLDIRKEGISLMRNEASPLVPELNATSSNNPINE